ncbi:MAG: flagellar biosynthesis protein FlgA [Streptosporangiales bacterium]|nr:flagellar biosynthesis protein FlgA [Streptosporangiales bacterium]
MGVETLRTSESPSGAPGAPVPAASRVRGPRWRDARLLIGLLLVLASVAVGARLFATADRTTAVWAAARSMDEGSVLAADDLVKRQVRLLDVTDKYLAASTTPVGYVLTRAVGAGELMPSAAVRKPSKAASRRQVTVPVNRGRLPAGLAAGRRVDVYVTPESEAAEEPQPSDLAVSGAVVVNPGDARNRLGSAASDVGVVLSVPPDEVSGLLTAVHQGEVDLVLLPLGGKAGDNP